MTNDRQEGMECDGIKGGPVLIDAQPLDRRFERLAGSTEFRGRSRRSGNPGMAPGESSCDY